MSTSKPKLPVDLDDRVLALFNTVRQQQREIKDSEKPRWVTTCTIGSNPDTVTDRVNIQTVTDTAKLIDLYAFLLSKEDYFKRAALALGIKASFKWMGATVDQWEKDFKTRLAQIELSAKRTELKVLEARLDNLITVDQRRALELSEIEAQLGSASE